MDERKVIVFGMIILLFISLVWGIAIEGNAPGINGTNGTNAVLGTLVFALHNTSSDVTTYASLRMDSTIVPDVPLTSRTFTNPSNGNTLLLNWTSLPMNLTLIPAGSVVLHIHATLVNNACNDFLWYDIGIVNSTGGDFSSIGISPMTPMIEGVSLTYDIDGVMLERIVNLSDRMALRLYLNQSGVCQPPTDIIIYMDDLTASRLTIPAIPIDLTTIINNIGNNTAMINKICSNQPSLCI